MIALQQNLSVRQFKAPSISPGFVPLDTVLDRRGCDDALTMLRKGLDTVDIAWRLECTQAAAANGIAHARDRERGL